MQCIGIKKGKYAGVVYKYGKVSLGEETEDGKMPFKFEFDIVDNNLIPREEFDGDEFPKQAASTWAPNLALTKERLNPDWVKEWLRNPISGRLANVGMDETLSMKK